MTAVVAYIEHLNKGRVCAACGKLIPKFSSSVRVSDKESGGGVPKHYHPHCHLRISSDDESLRKKLPDAHA